MGYSGAFRPAMYASALGLDMASELGFNGSELILGQRQERKLPQ